MSRHVNAIAGRLSLRPPQRRSLEILDRLTELVPPKKGVDVKAALEAIRAEFTGVTDFEREFPSLCFALATGVGKTRLMGAFISYLHLARGINNFFVLAPNLTIYDKLITDFTPNTPKDVFKGVAEFSVEPPLIVTGDNYESGAGIRAGALPGMSAGVHINIFNISKINAEVRGGKSPRIKRLSEYIGQSYFDYLAGLEDLALIMDESHRYRASAGVRAINELKPVIGLELTATPFVETGKEPTPFKNVVYDYPLAKAMEDGFVKEPAVVTRKDFNPSGMGQEAVERLKLEDGLRLHESVKVELETYARETGNKIVKPFLLVISRDTTHAGELLKLIQSGGFFEGRYKDKVIQVDSSRTGAEEDEMVRRLLAVEHAEEPTEIVIHVNMLKEGWDVTNLYTIVPLRAANARTLIEQSIGRGLRLPYGVRTGAAAVDRLNIVAHDRFQEIVDEANRPGSTMRLKQVILTPDQLGQRLETVVSRPRLEALLGKAADGKETRIIAGDDTPVFQSAEERKAAGLAREAIRRLENLPQQVPGLDHLRKKEIQAGLVRDVTAQYGAGQMELAGAAKPPDIASVVAKTTDLVVQQTIGIPRILVVPKGRVKSGFKPFALALDGMKYPAVSEDLWIQHLRTNEREVLALGDGAGGEKRLEDYVVGGLMDFDDISYDDHADLLYDLAGQAVRHFKGYLSEEETGKLLRCHQKEVARFIHAQMQDHYWEEVAGYEAVVNKGFCTLKDSAYTRNEGEAVLDFHNAPKDKSNMARYLFGGFERCLYPVQKFQSDGERRLAVILDREAVKWMKPAKGQFQIYYRLKAEHSEYQPDFVAETADTLHMIEVKKADAMNDEEVKAKKEAALQWCRYATEHAVKNGLKPWKYALVPHDAIADNMTLQQLVSRFNMPIK
jgi:type III restriction enzyme